MGSGQKLYKRAKNLIPGGTQLLSKRPEMFLPDYWPAYYKKAKGCGIWDLDGKKFTDMSYMGIGANILGYCDADVDAAVKCAISRGNMSTLNCPEEIELAELLCRLHKWAGMARYARTGGEAAAIAVRIARAKTGRDKILFCGYHGWHDWYLSANLADDSALDGHLLPGLSPKGVPRALRGTSIPFEYNNTEGFLQLIEEHGEEAGAVIMEPLRNVEPEKGFLEAIRRKTKELGIVLIFDEITAGWRLNLGGSHLNFGVSPDIALFGKAMSNGYPMAAVLGTRDALDAAQETFISSTYWTEGIGPAAALATIGKLEKENVPKHLVGTGKAVKRGWAEAAQESSLDIAVSGIDPLGHFSFNHEKPLVLKTLFTQKMLERGFLATTAFYASLAHRESHVQKYLGAVQESFGFISKAVGKGNPERELVGKPCHPGFKRLA